MPLLLNFNKLLVLITDNIKGGKMRVKILCLSIIFFVVCFAQAKEPVRAMSTFSQMNTLRERYLTSHKKWLTQVLADSEVYRLYVRQRLRQMNMPSFLEYLPIVESSYMPTARSKVGALGVWQFMLNSVKPFLKVNEYVDERLDVYKSTDAALLKLQDNYKMFGDWFLAITAYNCGAGALQKAMRISGKKDFWALAEGGYLKKESTAYVPKLLAIADVVENAALYNTEFPQANEGIDTSPFDYITVQKEVSLPVLASALRIDEKELLELNRSLIKGVTPPNTSYTIRLPAGCADCALLELFQKDLL